MAYSASRKILLRIDKSPTYIWNNLASSGESLAWAHNDSVVVLRGAAWDARTESSAATLECLIASKSGAHVTSLAWVPLARGAHVLAATTHEEFVVFSSTGNSIVLSTSVRALPADILRERAPAEHFFRGIAALRAFDVILVGTSWGDVLAWCINSVGAILIGGLSGGGSNAQVASVLRGAHTAPIVAITTDDK